MPSPQGPLPRVRMTQTAGQRPTFEIDGTATTENYSFTSPYGLGDDRVKVQVEFMAVIDRGLPEPETAEQRRKRLEREAVAALTVAAAAWQADLDRLPGMGAVLDLHHPMSGYQRVDCAHCEQSDGMEATENVPWPCATYTALTSIRHLTDSPESACALVDMGEQVNIDVPVGGVRSGYTASFTPDEIKPIRAAASAAGKTTSAYLHDLAVEASAPVTVNVTVQGPLTEQDIARAIENTMRRQGLTRHSFYR